MRLAPRRQRPATLRSGEPGRKEVAGVATDDRDKLPYGVLHRQTGWILRFAPSACSPTAPPQNGRANLMSAVLVQAASGIGRGMDWSR